MCYFYKKVVKPPYPRSLLRLVRPPNFSARIDLNHITLSIFDYHNKQVFFRGRGI